MSSRFVSAGAIDAASGQAVEVDKSTAAGTTTGGDSRNEEWEAVQRELEAERRRRNAAAEAARRGEGQERSLYEVLQANKAAKQAAFEEQNRIKNQFRPLDEDEIGFLDNVRRAEREREEALRRETEEELSRFREARTKRERGPGEDKPETEAGIDEAAEQEEAGAAVEEWTVGGSASRKRKREREGKGLVIKGLKRTSRADHDDDDHQDGEDAKHHRKGAEEAVSPKRFETTAGGQAREAREAARTTEPQATVVKPRLGLVDYGSDDDDDNDE